MADVFHATGFKRALDLFENNRLEEGKILLKSLQEEFLAVCEENQILKEQLNEVAEVLDLAERVEYDGQKYWLAEEDERKGPFCQLCYDREGLLVHLQPHGSHWECQSCNSIFMAPKTDLKAAFKEPSVKPERKRTIPLFLEREIG
ncbi:hypothetical protein [Salidesulfovibrio onnuriiensis]|uniref:hypothetical protein n=1 Tax=Salidesulfovibrio onnuriiensis TaxID=2583823 RepID=UPI0011CCAF33|nr:hypothetical protein [Salidesulfovibrio onnuriiensis]